ncbi:MAG: hypothetical protein H7098_04095 [Oligoflexus sp.]|nr:hypothetical protein [Pseudopedobacter sp.]
MKTKILSFPIFLFLMLVALLSTHSGKVFNQNFSTQKPRNQFSKSLLQDQKISILMKHDLSNYDDDFISVENDDDDFVFIRKLIIPTHYLMSFLLVAIFIFCLLRFKNRLPSCNHFSYAATPTYLLQRVLKI